MKLFTTSLAVTGYTHAMTGYAHAMTDCAHAMTGGGEYQCKEGRASPHCGHDELCKTDSTDNPCSFYCIKRDFCEHTIWRSAGEESNNSEAKVEYVDYCAEKPYKSAYTCDFVEGVATVIATFLPITRSHPEKDFREYQFYNKNFKAADYVYGMFGQASDNCTDLLGKTIDDQGYTTFTFPLEGLDSAVDECGIQVSEYKEQNQDGKETNYQKFEFAFGLENLVVKTPLGEALLQPGKHTNLGCEVVLSDDVARGFRVTHERLDENVDDKNQLKFTMSLWEGKDQNDKFIGQYGPDESPELLLQVEQEASLWIYIEVASESTTKYTHIENCSLKPLRLDGTEIGNEDSSRVIEDGCISRYYENNEGFDYFLWMNEKPREKGDLADRFGLQVYEVEGAANYKVECRLSACESCDLRGECPYQNRYDNIFGNNRVRRSAGTEIENNHVVISRTFTHPCQQFSDPGRETVCVPDNSSNCWLRTACEGRYN